MAETYRTTLKLRRGYAEVWERNNPILQEGEPGFALDTKVLKIGDGATPWLELKGIDSNDGNYDDIISELESKLIGKPGSGQNSEIFNNPNNIASGVDSHAEGRLTKAINRQTHAEGDSTLAGNEVLDTSQASPIGDYGPGAAAHAEGIYTNARGAAAHSEGYKTQAIGNESHAEGLSTIARDPASHAEGESSVAYSTGSHAEGKSTSAGGSMTGNTIENGGSYAHSEGVDTVAFGRGSHAEGESTLANNKYSHAEGGSCQAYGDYSHAEGCNSGNISTTTYSKAAHAEGIGTWARGEGSHTEGKDTLTNKNYAHAEGEGTVAGGVASHSEGKGTIAAGDYQHAQGKYNVEDTENKYAHIVGGGSSDTGRKNLHTVDWGGAAWFASGVKVGGISQNDENSKELATKEYVDNAVKENNFELIEQVEITEEVDGFVRSREPDGKSYKFKRLYLRAIIPGRDTAIPCYTMINEQRGVYFSGAASAAGIRMEMVSEVKNGALRADGRTNTNTNSVQISFTGMFQDGYMRLGTSVIYVVAFHPISGTLPVGTTIEIWGVRA